jgi:hypothetical protein
MVSHCAEPVVSHSLKPAQFLRIEACDPRADNRRRVIDVARDGVVIHRSVAGVAMAIRVLSSAYRGVALRVTGLHEGRFRYEARLLHRDPDLSVPLAEGEDQETIETQWREWVRFLRLPALVGRTGTGDVEVNLDVTDMARRRPSPRRRGRALASRRGRFLLRRKVGGSLLDATIHCDPRVLFPGSKSDR